MKTNAGKPRVGLLVAGCYECLFMPVSGADTVFLIAANTREEAWAKKFLEPDRFITYRMPPVALKNFKKLDNLDILERSDLARIIKKERINALFGWLHSGEPARLARLKEFFRTTRLTALSTDFRLKRDFENKIWFDRFLAGCGLPKPKSRIFTGGGRLPRLSGCVVLQFPYTAGGEETFILESVADIRRLERKKIIERGKRYLVREFVQGAPLGITVFITPALVALSAVRRQCAMNNSASNRPLFNGIEWLSDGFFRKKTVDIMNEVFLEFGRKLHSLRFYAFANIDFIVDEYTHDVRIIECNPRLSSSTIHLFVFPELISGISLNEQLITIFSDSRLPGKNPRFYKIPSTEFRGATLDISGFHQADMPSLDIRRDYKPGVYSFVGGHPRYLTPDFREFRRNGRQFILTSFVSRGEVYDWNSILAAVITNFSLYDASSGRLNRDGKRLLDTFRFN